MIADLLWGVLDRMGRPTDASVADVLYVGGYVLLAVALGSMLRSGTQEHSWGDIVDAGIIAVSAALVLWPIVFEPTLALGWSATTVVALAYSAGDVVLLALLAALFFEGGRRTISFSLMVVAVSLVFAADLVYYIPALAEGAAVGPLTNAAWLAGYIVFGAAGLHRSARAGAISSGSAVDSPLRRLRFLGVALLALPCGYLLDTFTGDGFSAADFRIFVVANAAIGILVVLRTGLLLHTVERAQRAASLAQGRFESVFQSAGLGISITTGGVMAQTNSAFQELVGYCGEELSRMRPTMIVHPGDVHDVAEEGAVVASATFERRYVHRDGSIVQTHVTLTSPRDEDFAIAVVEDITLRTSLEEQLREAQKMEAIGRLAGGVAHDFNNVLTVVSGHAELLREEVVAGPQGQEDITVILDAVRRASDLTRQLLAFSRLQELDPGDPESRRRRPRDRAAARSRHRQVRAARVVDRRLGALGERRPRPAEPGAAQSRRQRAGRDARRRDSRPAGRRVELPSTSWRIGPGVVPGRYCRITVSDTGTGMDEATQATDLRAVLHHETRRPGHGARPRDDVRHRQAERWPHLRRVPARPRHDVRDPAP